MTYSLSTISRNWPGGSLASLSAVSIAALLVLSACSSVPQALNVQIAPVEVERPDDRPPLPNPQPIEQREVTWKVLTPETLPKGDGWVYFGVTPENYEDMALNHADVLRFTREAMWRLRYYRGELEDEEQPDAR